jgi:hypothetical protein
MLLSRHLNAGQNKGIKMANRLFGHMSRLKYLWTTVTNQNLIQEEIKRRLNSGNACYQSVQNLLSSHLLLKDEKIRIYKTIILPVVLYGCWSLTLREEHRLRVFQYRAQKKKKPHGLSLRANYTDRATAVQYRALRRILDQEGMRWWEGGGNCMTRSFMVCTLCQVQKNNQVEEEVMGGACRMNGGEKECV